MELGVSDDPKLQAAFEEDQVALTETLLQVLYSASDEVAILALEEDAAQSVLDIFQYTLDHALVHTREATSKARKLMGKLCEKCDKLPSSLIISGVTQRDEHVSFPGGYGDVFRAMYEGKPVALKYMRMFQDTDQRDIRRRFCREALVWQRLCHPHIVQLIGIDTESFPPSLCLVSPWMKNGTVNTYLKGKEAIARQRTANRLLQEIAQGLAFLHGEHVVHGDLRGANILVSDAGNACITDFGLTVLSDASTSQTRNGGGCPRWMAPEMMDPDSWGVQNRPRTEASDIYAFACVCLELYTGSAPFSGVLDAAVIYQVTHRVRPRRPTGNVIPDTVWDIMRECWAHNFADRPTILEIVDLLSASRNPPADTTISTVPVARYQSWLESAISPFTGFIDILINPREYYLDLEEIAECPGGTATLYVARLADCLDDSLALPAHVKEQDRQDRLAQRTTFVAIKSVPILPSGNAKLDEVLHELSIMRDLRCENVLSMDALYVDPEEDALWIRMELMARSLLGIIELSKAGLTLSDRIIAGFTKDIISALEFLRVHDIAPTNLRSSDVLINNYGVLKLTNLSNAVKLSTSTSSGSASDKPILPYSNIASNATSLCLLLQEGPPPSLTFHQFMQMYFDLEDGSPLSSIASRPQGFKQFIKMCFEPTVTSLGYQQLIESAFIRDACERSTLAQLLTQCTAFEARLRAQRRLR
ncbi:kinase-like domain-containing protein [Mycena galopus ATCC 62051]|nr:kinase-like domain-containing protein [Mycena galopus ATCC 62051]